MATTYDCWRYFTKIGWVRMEKKEQSAIVATK